MPVKNRDNRKKKVTIADVAKLAGVGIATVSRVINDKGEVREETQARVFKAIQELDFVPSLAARSIKKNHSRKNPRKTSLNIGVMVNASFKNDPYFYHILNGIEQELSIHGSNCIYSQIRALSKPDAKSNTQDANISRLLFEGQLDGIIVVAGSSEFVEIFQESNIPVVFIDHADSSEDHDYLSTDNIQGAYKAVSYLISLGHTRIAHIKCSDNWFFNELEKGYKRAMQENALSYSPDLVMQAEDSFESGFPLVKRLVEEKLLPTAFFSNDRVSIGILNALVLLGYHVPDDVSVFGYDDIDAASYSNPPLSTIQVPKKELGMLAARRVIEKLQGDTRLPAMKVLLSTRMVVRKSTGPYRPGKLTFP